MNWIWIDVCVFCYYVQLKQSKALLYWGLRLHYSGISGKTVNIYIKYWNWLRQWHKRSSMICHLKPGVTQSGSEGLRSWRTDGVSPSPSSKAWEPSVPMSESRRRWISWQNKEQNHTFLAFLFCSGPDATGWSPCTLGKMAFWMNDITILCTPLIKCIPRYFTNLLPNTNIFFYYNFKLGIAAKWES